MKGQTSNKEAKRFKISSFIRDLVGMVIDFFKVTRCEDEVLEMPYDTKHDAIMLGIKGLIVSLLGLGLAFSLTATNYFVEHGLIPLAILFLALYYSKDFINELFSLYRNAENEKISLKFDNFAVSLSNKIIVKTSNKIMKYNEEDKFYKIMDNEVILRICRNYTLCLWKDKVTHPFQVIEFVLTFAMIIASCCVNTQINSYLFAVTIVGFTIVTFVNAFIVNTYQAEQYENQRECEQEQAVIINDLLNVSPIVPQDLKMRIDKFGETVKSSNKNAEKFTKKINKSNSTVSSIKFISNMFFIGLYTYNTYQTFSLVTVGEIIAEILIFNTIIGKTQQLANTIIFRNRNVVAIKKEESDMKLILEKYYEECDKESKPKVVENIHINPFRINYCKNSENDKPFSLCSKEPIEINKGEIVILYGPSGSGKSTFMKMLTDRIRLEKSTEVPSTSRFLMYDENLRFGSLSLFEELFCCSTNPNHTKMHEILNHFHLWNELEPYCDNVWKLLKEKVFKNLSNGQKQRIILAKMLYWLDKDIDVLVLDECTSGLDERLDSNSADAEKILEYIIQYANQDKPRIIIIATHQNIDGLKMKLENDYTFKNLYFEKDGDDNVIRQ